MQTRIHLALTLCFYKHLSGRHLLPSRRYENPFAFQINIFSSAESIVYTKHTSSSSYVVEGHLAEQIVHQFVHAPGSRMQVGLFHQHRSDFVQAALQHEANHLHGPQTGFLISGDSESDHK